MGQIGSKEWQGAAVCIMPGSGNGRCEGVVDEPCFLSPLSAAGALGISQGSASRLLERAKRGITTMECSSRMKAMSRLSGSSGFPNGYFLTRPGRLQLSPAYFSNLCDSYRPSSVEHWNRRPARIGVLV